MAGSRSKNLVAGAACISLAVHGGFALLANRLGIADGRGTAALNKDSSPPMLIAWADAPPEPAVSTPPTPEPVAPEPPRPPPPEDERVVLGITSSNQSTDNWMGFDEPTPHSAPRSTVEQPALDPLAGTEAPAGLAGLPTPPAPESPPAPPLPPIPRDAAPAPAAVPPPSEPLHKPVEQAEPQSDQTPTPADDKARPEDARKPQQDPVGEDPPAAEDPEAPLTPDGKTAEPLELAPSTDRFVGPPLVESPAPQPPSEPETPPDVPEESPPQQQAPVLTPPSPLRPPAPTGTKNPGKTPGEVSDRESDASSIDEPVEIRLGRPAAAKGLEIVTRRPDFSRITRLTVYPSINPRLKVTFNREGRVSLATFIDPTGLTEVDSPVLHAVYRWTAKGEALSKLPVDDPKAGLTITVTILLR